MTIQDFDQFGGRNTETAALKNALAHAGVIAPHTGSPYSETLLFGLGGGIGFSYFLFEQAGVNRIHLGTRIHTKETERPEFFERIGGRLGLQPELLNSSSATAAAANLRRQLEQGQAPIVFADPQRLPYLGLNAGIYAYYAVVVYGANDENGDLLISDRCRKPVSVSREDFRNARNSSWSPKYRAIVVRPPQQEPDLAAAVMGGIQDSVRQMNGGLGITNFGLRGLEKWATVLTSSKEKKSWQKIFSPGQAFYQALFSMFMQIATRGGTGNAHRAFYAEFLDEAAELLSRPALREAAQLFRHSDQEWAGVAGAHMPSSVPLMAEARDLAVRRLCLFESKGPDAAAEIQEIRQRLAEIEKEASVDFPLSLQDSRALLHDLRQRILKLRDCEMDAFRALEAAIS